MSDSSYPEFSSKTKYAPEELWFPLSEDILNWDYDFHLLMLNDKLRMTAYEKGIKETIKPGMTVVDIGIGTGTGVLSLWALEAKAKKVYGIDINKSILEKAKERIKEAGFSDRYFTFNKVSYDVELPEKVDVIVSEILGNLGDNEDMTPILNDAKKRFLKPSGFIIPKVVDVFLVPISSGKLHSQVKNKKVKSITKKYDIDNLLSLKNTHNQFSLYYDAIIPNVSCISEPQKVQSFLFEGKDKSEYEAKKVFIAEQNALFTGSKGYFIANLSDNVKLDISGDNIKKRLTSDYWKHCYLPIEKPIRVKKYDEIEITYARFYPKNKDSAFKQCYSWKGIVKRAGSIVEEFNQNMCK